MTRWYFLRTGPGALAPLDPADLEAFVRGSAVLPADADARVHYVGLEIETRKGTPLGVRNVWFARCRVKADGTLDQGHMLEIANARTAVARALEDAGDVLPPGLAALDAEDRFRARWTHLQSRWEPSQEDVDALRALVNARAGWSMI